MYDVWYCDFYTENTVFLQQVLVNKEGGLVFLWCIIYFMVYELYVSTPIIYLNSIIFKDRLWHNFRFQVTTTSTVWLRYIYQTYAVQQI